MKALSGKPKKCKQCGESFVPARTMQKVCGVACSLAYAKTASEAARTRAEKKAHREAREKVKTRAEYMREAQAVFNRYIRARDADQPCISCGTTADVQYAAGHYRTTAACPELRFHPLNVHKQCNRNCNMAKSGALLDYRIGLIRKIGIEAVEWLEGPHEPRRYTIDDLKAIKAEYRQKLRELDRQRLP